MTQFTEGQKTSAVLLGIESFGQMGVILYQAWTAEQGVLAVVAGEHLFTLPLPIAPWTYTGKLVKLEWLVRVRLRFGPEGDEVREVGFTLTPPGR